MRNDRARLGLTPKETLVLLPGPIPPHDPRASDRRLDWLTCLFLSALVGFIVFIFYKGAPFEFDLGSSNCHWQGGIRESIGAAAALGGGLWLLEAVLAFLLRRRVLYLVLLGVGFVLLYVAGLVVLGHEAPRFWGPERCVY
jgi:hypothetical protein